MWWGSNRALRGRRRSATRSAQAGRCVLVIGPGWSAALEKARRDGQDFVELEVQIALDRPDVSVIPVLVGGAAMPTEAELPGSLRELAGREALELHDDTVRWDHGSKL